MDRPDDEGETQDAAPCDAEIVDGVTRNRWAAEAHVVLGQDSRAPAGSPGAPTC